MKSNKEIYTLVLKELEQSPVYQGICGHIGGLLDKKEISREEYKKILIHFREQKPYNAGFRFWKSRNKQFTYASSWQNQVYWWTLDYYGDQERRKFLKYLINNSPVEETNSPIGDVII